MKILFFSDNFPPEHNACASRVYERAVYWVNWGHQVTFITGAPNFPEGRVFDGYRNRWHSVETMDGIRVVRVKTFIAPNQGVALRLVDFLSFMVSSSAAGVFEQRPDAVVATSPQFFTAVAGNFIATVKRVPFIFELSDLWPATIHALGAMRNGWGLRMIERLELHLYRRAARIVALTRAYWHDLVARGIPPEKIAVVINGVDASRYRPRSRNQELVQRLGLEGCFVVGYIGTHGMAHALEKVLEAAEILRSNDSVRFLFVGTGAARSHLMDEAQRRRLPNVVFAPPQPKENTVDFWSLCDAALVHLKNAPLFSTVIPSKIFEAMAMGVPILLAAPEGEARSVVQGAEAGIVVPAERPQALAHAVARLQVSSDLRAKLASNGLRAALRYTREKQARDMLAVLEEACCQTQVFGRQTEVSGRPQSRKGREYETFSRRI
jgi:glycosyltransferase involved in cell wall biosynthesis